MTFGDYCTVNMGQAPSGKFYNSSGHGLPLLAGAGDMGEIYPTPTRFSSSTPKVCDAGEIILCIRATIGKKNWADRIYCLGRGVASISPINSEEVFSNYIWHWLTANEKNLLNKGRGATFLQISKKDIEDIPCFLPSISEQRRIAAILDKADAIRRKRQQSLTLIDDLVKSQFIEMFGDWNEMERWPCTRIAEIADVTVGVVIKPAQYYTEEANGIRAFRSLNVGEMRVRDDDWVYFTPDGHKANDKSELRAGDVLVVRSGYPGTSCVVPNKYHGSNAIDVIIARPDKSAINPLYLCAFTNFTHGKHQVQAKTGGAAQQHFNVGAYKDMIVSLPPLPLQNQFAAFVEQTDKSKFAMQRQLSEIEILSSALKQKFFA